MNFLRRNRLYVVIFLVAFVVCLVDRVGDERSDGDFPNNLGLVVVTA